jgi:hypothetical protein
MPQISANKRHAVVVIIIRTERSKNRFFLPTGLGAIAGAITGAICIGYFTRASESGRFHIIKTRISPRNWTASVLEES